MARTPIPLPVIQPTRTPILPDLTSEVDPEHEEAMCGLTAAIDTAAPGVPVGLDEPPEDDLMAIQHVEQPQSAPKYDRYMQNERHDRTNRGVDEETGWRYETWDIGMTRGAKNKKLMTVFLDPIPHVLTPWQSVPLRGWYKGKFEPANIRPRPCFTDALLTSPYLGTCSVGCPFCYVNSGHRGYRGQGVTTVDVGYPDKIAKQLKTMRTGAAVYMSSFIDPFIELEDYYHNTQRTAWAAIQEGLPIFFLTRKQPPGWAFDYLKQNNQSYCQYSINTSSHEDWKLLSPRAVSLETTLGNVEEMSKQGIYVSIQVNPIVAGVTSNEDIVALIHDLARRGAKTLIFKFVEISYPSAEGMKRQIRARFRERTDAFDALFTQNIGGMRTIDEEYRIAALDLFSSECRKAGVHMSTCYEYSYERDAEGKVLSKTGVSLGPKYVTSSQCHGKRVPIFSRATTDVPFEPIDVCPDTGCLYCTKPGHEAEAPCGNPLLAAAPAWDPVMLKEPAYTLKHGGSPEKLLARLKIQPPAIAK